MSGQALARHDVAPVIHPHRVQHVLCDIDPEDVHLWFPGTRLLWLNGFTDLNSLWLIAVDPHRGVSISLRPNVSPSWSATTCFCNGICLLEPVNTPHHPCNQ